MRVALLPLAGVVVLHSLPRYAEHPGPQEPGPLVSSVGAPQFFALRVRDLDAAVAWYAELLGLEELDRTRAEDGTWEIANLRSDALFVEVIRDERASPAERALGFAKVGFGVPDVRVLAARLERESGLRPRVIEIERHGLRLVQLRDPEGNVLQLVSPLDGSSDDAR